MQKKKIFTSSFANTADTGKTPPDNALPKIKISGFTFSWSTANIFPVLHNPVWTSSAIHRTFKKNFFFGLLHTKARIITKSHIKIIPDIWYKVP